MQPSVVTADSYLTVEWAAINEISLPPKLREHYRKGGRKNVRARGRGGETYSILTYRNNMTATFLNS